MISKSLFFLVLGSVYASALACIDLNNSLENKVNALIKKSYPNITFELLKIEDLNTKKLDNCDYVKFEMPEKLNIQNDFILKLDAYKDDKFIKRHTKVYRFDGRVNVLKTVKLAERGDQLDLKFLKKDVTSIYNITKHTISHFPKGNIMFRNYVSSDEIIESWMLEPIPDVSKGEIVRAILKKQNITLTLDGRVLENGIIGESIKLKLNEKIVIGKLQDEKTVIINSI